MGLNKQKGNMYPFVTHTLNFIKGKCPHDCSYCYMKIYPQPELHFDEKELKVDLGEGNFIFVGSSCDGWSFLVPADWVFAVLGHCRRYPFNRYLFQSKDPSRFLMFLDFMPPDFVLGTTLETNRDYEITQAPTPEARMLAMLSLPMLKMVSIEPIMDFDLDDMVRWIKDIAPIFVSIGADSKGHKLPEPSEVKTHALIERLRGITKVYIKNNLKRLLGQEMPVCQKPQ